MKYTFSILFILMGFINLKAQILNFSSEPEKFIEEYNKQVQKAGIQTSPDFSPFYDSLSTSDKKNLISFAAFLSKKGVKQTDIVKMTDLLPRLKSSQILNAEKLSYLLNSIQKSFDPYPGKQLTDAINQLDIFSKTGEIYSSPFNKVRLTSGTFSVQYFDSKQPYFKDIIAQTASEPVDIGWDEKVEDYDPWKDDKSKKNTAIDARVNLPLVNGLYFSFEKTNLLLLSPSDSIVIENTSGVYNFLDNTFIGSEGTINWNINEQQLTATLDKYSFKSTSGKLIAEKVKLQNSVFLKKDVLGVLEIKLEKRAPNELSTYPRFKSYHNNADFSLPLEDYDFLAGFTVVGKQISSGSLFDKYTKLLVNKESKTEQFEVIGQSLIVTDSLITSDLVSFVARIRADSVSHPGIQFRFDLKNKVVKLNKVQKGGFRNSLFSDTFHQVDIRCDAMSWNISSGKMDFYIIAAKQEVAAEFESFDFYNAQLLRNLSSLSGFNPLMAATTIVSRKKKNAITVEEMMQMTKKERYMVSNAMLIGNQMGFFDYHPFGNYYSVSRKGRHYYFVLANQKDYDDLVFSSLNKAGSDKSNASIDFNSQALDILGAQNFKLSDSLGIKLIPENESLKVLGNKVFSFNGKIVVKNYTFYGDFVLDYEKFLVNLNRIDSITFIPIDIYKKGGKYQIGGNFAYGKTGKLFLNSPDNKSGRKKLPEFPKLEIQDGVTVYFNEKGRAHKFSEDVVFKASTLKLDSLNTTDPVIPGIFTTAQIFKPIKDNLVILPDSSMGMLHKATGPYGLYNSQSLLTADSKISLNKRGISTSGEIKHLAATLNADQILLQEDYSEASGTKGKITEKELAGVYFPDVNISEFKMKFVPSKDSMSIFSEKGFSFYNASSSLTGNLVVKTAGLFGDGDLERQDSFISSHHFKFEKTGFNAEKSLLKVKADEELAFSGKNVGIDFNIQKSIVEISAFSDVLDTEVAFLEFPSSHYKTTIDKATWNIKDKKISMEGNLENSSFTSTLQDQYGLTFNASGALYDIASKNLNISGVKEIHSADAAIQPNSGKVFVKSNGKLEPFENAIIVTDTLNRYHTLTNANVTINSKLSYAGNADYRFVNVSLDTFNIKLSNFEFAEISPEGKILDSKGSGKLSTIARATVNESDNVFLAKKMLYKGELTMLSPFKNLSLKGQVLPDLKKYPMIGGSWIDYKGNKSENVSINIDETLKDGGKPLYVGLHMKYGANTDGIYPSFLSMKGSSDDTDIFVAKGMFGRDENEKMFYVKTENEPSNSAKFYDDKGILELSGQFNLLGVPTKVFETVGTAKVNLDSMKYAFESMVLFDFPIPILTTQKLGQNIVKANLDAGNTNAAVEPQSEEFIHKLKQIIGSAETEKFVKEYEKGHVPLFKQSNKFLKALVLSKLSLIWNATANAYHSVGPIGISNAGDVDVNALVNGYVEIVQSHSTGNELHIYLDLSQKDWYYFVYRNGKLGIVSSDEEINKLINVPGGKEKVVSFVDNAEATRFKKRFVTTYNGLSEEEYSKLLKSPVKPVKKDEASKQKEEETEGF